MATIVQTTNITGAGVGFSFAAVNDFYYVLENVMVVSTGAAAVTSGLAGNRLSVDGTLVGGGRTPAVSMTAGSADVTIGATGRILSSAVGGRAASASTARTPPSAIRARSRPSPPRVSSAPAAASTA